ncbi:hypothetical protein Bbelb_004270 [Branchiostoma belcheri]|nr:hypothetical protein Bbelb_004270 [Branchiostoma belcheri]
MASVHGREEQPCKNSTQEDAPRPLWEKISISWLGEETRIGGKDGVVLRRLVLASIEDSCLDLTREDWTRSGDLETQEQDDCNNIHRCVLRLSNVDPETGLQQEEEPDFCRQGCVKEDGEE